MTQEKYGPGKGRSIYIYICLHIPTAEDTLATEDVNYSTPPGFRATLTCVLWEDVYSSGYDVSEGGSSPVFFS